MLRSTYNNINTRFKLLKRELIELDSACATTIDVDEVDELIDAFSRSTQSNKFLININYSKVSTNSTSKICGNQHTAFVVIVSVVVLRQLTRVVTVVHVLVVVP